MLFAAVLLIAIGALMLLKPDIYWQLTESWKSSWGKPSSQYLDNTRITGALFLLLGLLMLLIWLLL